MTRNRFPLLAALAVCLLVSSARAQNLVLVENGVSRAPVVIFENAPPCTRQAADELAEYIEKTSGAKPEIIEGRPDPIPQPAIWVGYQPVMDEIFPDLDFDFQRPEEILIAATENHLVIAGRDRWNPDGLTIETSRGGTIEGKQLEYGTVNAVYTFLQDHLGVRWLWPGELGEDVLDMPTVCFVPFVRRHHPQIRARGGLFHYSSFIGGGYGTSQEWTRKQRLQLDSLEMAGGHAFSGWWERFKDTHPEYFALQPDGTRSGFPNPRTVKLCHANPAVAEQWLADVEAQLERDPNQRVFNASPNDGWASGHCVCEDCRAWDHPDGELRTFHWEGVGMQYPALSDREVTFANRCAELLKERYPDKDYYVLTMAYGHSRPAPVEAVPADNVIISSVANFLGRSDLADRGSPAGTKHRDQYAAWAELTPNVMWRPNTGSPAGWQQGQPDVSLTRTIRDFKYVAEKGCLGIFIDGVWEHWATHGPQYYVMAKMTYDTGVDAWAALDDYYQRGFDAGADDIKAYWQHLEDTRERFVEAERSYPEIYDQAFFEKAYGFLDAAEAKLADRPEIYRERVGFFRAGLDYTRLIVENRDLMARLRRGDGQSAELDRRARENWVEIERIVHENPYSLNWGPIRPQTTRMRNLHPDHADMQPQAPTAQAVAAAVEQPAEVAEYKSAREAGWTLAFEDDFNRGELGEGWRVLDGDWSVQDGALRGSGAIVTSRGFPEGRDIGFQRMEFEASTAVEPMEFMGQADRTMVRVSDLSSMIHFNAEETDTKQPFNIGYFFQFGGNWNRRNQIRKGGAEVALDTDPTVTIAPDTFHHIVVENDHGDLRMFVDEEPVIAHRESGSILGEQQNRVGFYFHTAAKVRNVKVYVKTLPDDLDLD